ncbi:MAG: acyl-ACP--UDP-N-acetylglucosamine O-acyltransferase [Candidatus Omnitrophica bacterium]|nr:acyl-ACP--UDP-N-acetylglucosamine O-acyltransferase [Candidatus Omnitrophota bacterium]MBU4303003.1 acyl-ACP--UDP-N-acetylglucosamine O-acyltransferase [Candidatus Omnitrophota bacterium]MBU4468515.1 acyl-ACP--UDP-N-acetylglucosamine O-acyltransferase [Candidatus Omnitrophota bacterium]MCG2707977.1 acyl-ACP--UDP-N-acetylglucosamine O-acyltransferase [Candidatus Omnitrophota bacterium]
MLIHPSAIVSPKAKLASGVSVGPFSIISDQASIGADTKIGAHCVIEGNTTIGKNCEIFTGAVIGSRPQDLKFKGEKVFLEIGNNNIIREYCTLNPGTAEGSKTSVGDDNLLMAYSHVAHDCRVGNGCVLANNSTLAGHVSIEDKAVIGGIVAIHQFVRIGMLAIVGGCSKVVQDIPPFSTCDGHPARVYGLNLIGLRRKGISHDAINKIDQAFKLIFNSGLSAKHALERVEKEIEKTEEIIYLVNFLKSSERGFTRSCR